MFELDGLTCVDGMSTSALDFSQRPAAVYGAAEAHSDEVIREHAAPRRPGRSDGRDHAAGRVMYVVATGVLDVDVDERDSLGVGKAVGVWFRLRVHCP